MGTHHLVMTYNPQWTYCMPGKLNLICQCHKQPGCKLEKLQVTCHKLTDPNQQPATNWYTCDVQDMPKQAVASSPGKITSILENSGSYIITSLYGATYRFARFHIKPYKSYKLPTSCRDEVTAQREATYKKTCSKGLFKQIKA